MIVKKRMQFPWSTLLLGLCLLCVISGAVLLVTHSLFKTSPKAKDNAEPQISQSTISSVSSSPSLPLRRHRDERLLKIPTLMYHYVREVNKEQDNLGYNLSVKPADFEKQMVYLSEQQFVTLSPTEVQQALTDDTALPDKSVWLTFDDGYEDFYTTVFPLLKKYQLKATLYVITDFVGKPDGEYVTWDQLKEMDNSGLVTIGDHTVSHVDLSKATVAVLRHQVVDSKTAIEKQLGHAVDAFCYPSGKFNDQVVQEVKDAGFTTAVTTQPGFQADPADPLRLPRQRITNDLPMMTFEKKVNP